MIACSVLSSPSPDQAGGVESTRQAFKLSSGPLWKRKKKNKQQSEAVGLFFFQSNYENGLLMLVVSAVAF